MADRRVVSVCNFYLESNRFACIAVPSCFIFKFIINLALPLDIFLDGSSERNQKEVSLCTKMFFELNAPRGLFTQTYVSLLGLVFWRMERIVGILDSYIQANPS